jgi:hypothetical protein
MGDNYIVGGDCVAAANTPSAVEMNEKMRNCVIVIRGLSVIGVEFSIRSDAFPSANG